MKTVLILSIVQLCLVLGNPVSDSGSECEPNGAFFPNYSDGCRSYYQCVNGDKILFTCPPPLLWNQDANTCDYPDDVDCTATSSTPDIHPDTQDTTVAPPAEPTTAFAATTRIASLPVDPTQSPTYEPTPSGGRVIVCYFTNWAWYRPGDGKFMPSDIDASLCTHYMYAFAMLSDNTIQPYDTWADIDNGFYEQLVALQSQGKKVFISIGGWNESAGNKYGTMAASAASRKKFIDSAVAFCKQYGFDGMGIDWEYPGCPQGDCSVTPSYDDKTDFALLVEEASAEFQQNNLGLSAAISPSAEIINIAYDVPTLNEHLEWVSVMSYDYHGSWDDMTGHIAPIYGYPGDGHPTFNVNYTVNYLLEAGLSSDRLMMGLPLYGKSFTLQDPSNHGLNAPASAGTAGPYTRTAGTLAYYEICESINQGGWTIVQDEQHRMGPYAYKGNQWVSYDDEGSLALKAQFIKDYNLAGAMVWDLAYDDFHNNCGGGQNPMLHTIKENLFN